MCNPYLAFALLIRAGLDGVAKKLPLPAPADFNIYTADDERVKSFAALPSDHAEAKRIAAASAFAAECLPHSIIENYTK